MDEKVDAKWIRAGKGRILFATAPLEIYNDAPNPFEDLAAFQKWAAKHRDRLEELADNKIGTTNG